MSREITEKQRAWTIAMYTVGGDTFGNGIESARTAKYSGNNNTLKQRAYELVTNSNVIKLKEQIQAKTAKKIEYNEDKGISLLHEALAMAKSQSNVAGYVSAIRELNSMCGYNHTNLHNDTQQPSELTADARAELKRLARQATNIKLAKKA